MRLLIIAVSALIITGCSDTNFSSSGADKSTARMSTDSSSSDPDNAIPISDSQEVNDQIDDNPACDLLFAGGANLHGQDYLFNGFGGDVNVGNAGRVVVNGLVNSVAVNGATDVLVNGISKAVCIVAKHVSSVNGLYGGSSTVPLVIMGQDSQSTIDSINGVLASNLVLMNMATGVINGIAKDIYISGGTATTINGTGGNLYLSDGAVVKLLNGKFGKITLSGGAVVLSDNSIHR
jgi:hypothetical protein